MGCEFVLHRYCTCADRGRGDVGSVLMVAPFPELSESCHLLRIKAENQDTNRTDIIEHSEILGPHTLLLGNFVP